MMPDKLFFFAIILFVAPFVKAQEISGSVSDRASQLKLKNVEVLNENTSQRTLTNDNGEFSIKAAANQVLIFYQPEYLPDTLFLVNNEPVKRYLTLNNQSLNTVEIKGSSFNPEVEYADVYRKAKAIKLSTNQPFTFYPSKYFSKEGKNARIRKRELELEKIERKIDARFNKAAITALTPLKGAELDHFMILYRPTIKELDKMDEEVIKFYLINSYKEFKTLPPEKKISPLLRYNKY